MDKLANQVDREDSGDIAKNMQEATGTNTSPKPTNSDNPGAGGESSSGGSGSSRGGSGSPVNSGGGSDDDTKDGAKVIVFPSTNWDDGRVFKVQSATTRIINFDRTDPKTLLQDLKWQIMNGSNITTLNSTSFRTKGSQQLTNLTNSTVTLNFQGETKNYYGSDMYLEIEWEKEDGISGYSRTELFTVTDNASEAEDLNAKLETDEKKQDALETTTGFGPSSTSGSSPSSTSGIEDSSSGGSNGLSTGATAGIAVGAVIGGLLIIGALVWFLLRRRRNKKSSDEYVTQQTYAVDKETHGRATDSPNSPYSDENHVRPVALSNLDRGRGVGSTPPPGGVPRSSIGSHDRAGQSGSQTPQGMSSNVAHLVEDGMTADEIRRLEEEERQLDDEIERAARR